MLILGAVRDVVDEYMECGMRLYCLVWSVEGRIVRLSECVGEGDM